MSTFPNPPDAADPGGEPTPAPSATPRPAASPRGGADADFEFMLVLRAAARSLDLRNRVVLARLPRTRRGPAAKDADPPRGPAHPA